MTTPKTLTVRQRRALRKAHRWRWIDPVHRTYADALEHAGLGSELKPFLRVMTKARREGHPISIMREFPQFMYVAYFPRRRKVKVGITLRHARPRVAVEARMGEHEDAMNEEPLYAIWAGSRERETALVARLSKKRKDRWQGREWFHASARVLRIIETQTGIDVRGLR